MWAKLWNVLRVWISGISLAAACTFPTNLASKTWRDSDKGDLVFTTNQMTGWSFNYISGSSTVSYSPTWECLNTTTDGSDLILILKSSITVQYDSAAFYRPFLCMRLTPITDVSYYYYLQFAEQTNLGYERIPIILEEAVSSITDPFQAFCLQSTATEYPSSKEYHMLVLRGSESLAIQDCPAMMYELFTYSVVDTNAGTSDCGGGNSRLDMCSDIKRMVFNTTLCTTTAAYSANGSLFCLVVLTSGSYTLHTVYNEDSSIDNMNTFRFSCFVSSVASDGTVNMSVSPRSCTKTQTPTTQPQLGNGTTLGLNINLSPVPSVLTCDFPCSIPPYLANQNWTDSDKGQLQFSSEGMTGWYFHSDRILISPTWKCFHTTTVNSSSVLILRGDSTVAVYGDIYRPFLCLNLRQITDVSYYYYLLWAEQDRLGYERVTIKKDSEESSITDPYTELCLNASLSTTYPTENEFHLLIKEGSESGAIQDCPSRFYGIYAYTVEDQSTGDTFCGSNDTKLDVCADYQRMNINYTHCNTLVAHSAGGNVFCVFSLTVGLTVIHSVYNEDLNVDNNTTFRFTCFISTISSDGNLTVSQSPKSCTKTQTPTTQPTLTNGTVVGLNLHISPFENGLCPVPTPQSDSSSTNTVVIIGSVLGSLLLLSLIAVILMCLFCKVCCCKRSAKVNTELNNNTEVTKKQKIQEKAVEKPDIVMLQETYVPVGKEKGLLENKTGHDLCLKKTNQEGLDVSDNDKVEESHKTRKEVQHSDIVIEEDLLITPSSIDITSLSHIRTHSRMETPFGMAPDDTHFQENGNVPMYNSFTLPLLQGKSLTNLSSAGLQDDKNSKVPFQHPLNESQKINSNVNCNVGSKTAHRKESELPDNPAIINSHFNQQNIIYRNTFMDLPRKEAVGPHNDHEFREKRNYSDKVVSSAKANTVLDIMSKEFGYAPYGGNNSLPSKEEITEKFDGTELLHSAKTVSSSQNKMGVFLVEAKEHNTPTPYPDDTIEGIAYDEDNQKARKQVHFVSAEENLVREITSHEFEYGAVKGDLGWATDKRKSHESSNTSFASLDHIKLNKEPENKDNSDDEDEEGQEDVDEEAIEADNDNDVFALDHSSLKTAMSVIYSESSEDPDKMSLRGYNL